MTDENKSGYVVIPVDILEGLYLIVESTTKTSYNGMGEVDFVKSAAVKEVLRVAKEASFAYDPTVCCDFDDDNFDDDDPDAYLEDDFDEDDADEDDIERERQSVRSIADKFAYMHFYSVHIHHSKNIKAENTSKIIKVLREKASLGFTEAYSYVEQLSKENAVITLYASSLDKALDMYWNLYIAGLNVNVYRNTHLIYGAIFKEGEDYDSLTVDESNTCYQKRLEYRGKRDDDDDSDNEMVWRGSGI